MINKKMFNLLITILAVIILSGCSATPKNQTQEPAIEGQSIDTDSFSSDTSPINTTFLQGSESGLWFMLSSGISEAVNREYNGSVINITPGSTGTNILRISDNQSEFGFTHSNIAYEASNALGDFNEKIENVKFIANMYPSVSQFILSSETGIKSFDQFFVEKPKLRIGIGSKGGSFATTFQKIVEAYGYTLEDLEAWGCKLEYKSQTDVSDMFTNGALDGYFVIASAPNPMTMELAVNYDLTLVKLDTEVINQLVNNFGFSETTIPSGVYGFEENEVDAFATNTILVASDETSPLAVYKMTKAIYENLDYLKSIHSSLEDMTPEYLLKGNRLMIHPGAEVFYKEVGLIID